jgi:hypothetical protein
MLTVQLKQICLKTNWSLQVMTKEEDCCQKLLSCTTTLLTPMSQTQQLTQFDTSSLTFCHIHLTVPTSKHATFIPLVHLQGHYMVTSLAVIMKWKTWCIHGLRDNLKLSSPVESGSFWTATKSVWKCTETMFKNNIAVMYVVHFTFFVVSKGILPLLFDLPAYYCPLLDYWWLSLVYYGSDTIKQCSSRNKSYSAGQEIPLPFLKPEAACSQNVH